jgi:transaldolase
MKATQQLHELGQSVWLDNINRDLLTSGTFRRYIVDLSLMGLTSNPTIFDQATAFVLPRPRRLRRQANSQSRQVLQ